ncbi:NinB protein [Novosphingobium indicum]|uniref:NinB protein n=1 Tax=Novosphingobium indicum TaxID=462949 RepID=A0ABQ2JPA0_9SPHN|nr:recombination protein NinB [Novosphingobium indicum]GGN49573.1 NinB protein [Novosphingobium indicum]
MSDPLKRTIFLVGDTQRQHAKNLIDQAPPNFVMRLGEATRSDAQNRKMWPMLADLQAQVPEFAEFSANDMKLRFLNLLGMEMRFLPALEGQGMFPVGMSSSMLTKSQFSGLIELIYAVGAKHGVQWSERSAAYFAEELGRHAA